MDTSTNTCRASASELRHRFSPIGISQVSPMDLRSHRAARNSGVRLRPTLRGIFGAVVYPANVSLGGFIVCVQPVMPIEASAKTRRRRGFMGLNIESRDVGLLDWKIECKR